MPLSTPSVTIQAAHKNEKAVEISFTIESMEPGWVLNFNTQQKGFVLHLEVELTQDSSVSNGFMNGETQTKQVQYTGDVKAVSIKNRYTNFPEQMRPIFNLG